jgi:hypothetical protein
MEMVEKIARTLADHYMVDPETCWPSYEAAARAAIEAMRDPSWEMMQAMYEAMFVDKWDGTQAPMIGAGFEAAIDAALSSSTRGE